jgi:hypothetical protein
MAEIDWRVDPRSEQSMTPAPSREEMASQQQQLEKTRAGIAGSLFGTGLFPSENQTSFSTLGGIVGGLAPILFPESRVVAPIMRLTEAAPAVVRPLIPSLAGSTAGTTAGTLIEQAITPNQSIFSTDTGKKLLENNLQNAAFDVGGNLVFSAFGKLIKAGKDQLNKAGITQSASFFATPEEEARRAAQEWLSARGATLTKGQLTGDFGTQVIEGTLKYSPASNYFEQQQKNVAKALTAGANDVRATLDTSDTFKNALKQDDPTQMALGDRFQNAISEADKLMKAKFAPVYEKIDADQGLQVNLVPLKQEAQKELDKLAKRKFIGAGSERRQVLEDILKQDDQVGFGTAHALRSDLLASGREATKEGVPSTVLQKEYFNQAQGVSNQMDNTMVITFGNEEEKALARKLGFVGGIDQPAGLKNGQYIANNFASIDAMNMGKTKANIGNNDLLREYFNAQNGYKNAMGGLYSGTMQAALKAEPSAVGEMLFNIDRPERMRDTFAAIAEMQKYLPKEQSAGLKAELQYGYLNKIFGQPDGITKLAQNLEDTTFKEGFNYLFREPQLKKQLLDITNAAKYGLETEKGSTVLRTKAIGAVVTGATAGASTLAYLNLPEEIQNKIDLPSAISSYGVLYLTPKMMGRALTNKNSMDALAMLSKAQTNPKYAGAAATKIADALNRSGILNEEYATDVNTFLHGAPKQESMQQAPVINWDVAPQAQPAQ